ncbi:MAG: HAD family hydrolase [Shimia sp.]
MAEPARGVADAPPISGVLLDMDGLLIESERIARDVFVAHAVAQGRDRDEALGVFHSQVGTAYSHSLEVYAAYFPDATPAETSQVLEAVFRDRVADGIPLRPTARAVVEAVAARGLPMAVVTMAHRAHAEANLTAHGLLDRFVGIVPGDEVPRPKPYPDPYRMGAELLGLDPAACAAFEDSDTGIAAAVAAGCRSWQVPDIRPAEAPLPDLGQGVGDTLWDAARQAGLVEGDAPA